MRLMEIIPTSTVFFGGINNLKIGENQWLDSKIIPSPSVFYGAIASKFLSENVDLANQKLKKGNRVRVIEIGKTFIKSEDVLYILAPYDLLKRNNSENLKISKRDLRSIKSYDNYEHENNMMISYDDFIEKYLNGSSGIRYKMLEKFYDYEYKVGIQIENKKAENGKLYRINQIELKKNTSYVVEYKIHAKNEKIYEEIPEKGFLKFGGENKIAKYRIIKNKLINNDLDEISEESYQVKVICISQTILKNKIILGDENLEDEIIYSIEAVGSGKSSIISSYNRKSKFQALGAGTILIFRFTDNMKKLKKIKDIKVFLKEKVFLNEYKNDIDNRSIRDGFSEIEITLI